MKPPRPGLLGVLAVTMLLTLQWGPCCSAAADQATFDGERHAVPRAHPRLLGSRGDLQRLAKERREAYARTRVVAMRADADDHARMISLALVAAIEEDAGLKAEALRLAMQYVDGPVRKGHVPFGHDLARAGIVYDLCHEAFSEAQRTAFHRYLGATVDANVGSETAVFHNGWYGYKHWGIGIAAYACYHEFPRARQILEGLEQDYRERAAPALELAGAGGSWAEGYYVNYWLYEWLLFCEVARACEGLDYLALAPSFYRQRAVAGMFATYPGIRQYGSRRPVPMGDGGGRLFGGDRDKALCSRRILVGRFRDDADHRAVHAFDETTPRVSVGNHAYKDLLWRDESVRTADLGRFRLSHVSPGPGHVFARSSWQENATYFFFQCGDRFTAHQHLDVGHFLVARHEELLGDGGHYDSFGSSHDVNYHLRSVAHNTILVHDPDERWPAIRAGRVTVNDGGQHHDFPHHNGSVLDPEQWHAQRDRHDLADLLAFEDRGAYLYVAGDATRAYARAKLEHFTRQIVFLRPGTFVVLDRVVARRPDHRKMLVLQAMKPPTGDVPELVVTNGRGRLFLRTLLPAEPQMRLVQGEELYTCDGQAVPPSRDTGPAPECRIEISPARPSREDLFLYVLTATDADVDRVPEATLRRRGQTLVVEVGPATIEWSTDRVGGTIRVAGHRHELAGSVVLPQEGR